MSSYNIAASTWVRESDEQESPYSMDNLFDSMFTTLTATDRCDGCSARAVSQYLVNGTILMLCGHHTRKHASALAAYPSRVPAEHSYQFTPREDSARPRDNRARDAGSSPLDK